MFIKRAILLQSFLPFSLLHSYGLPPTFCPFLSFFFLPWSLNSFFLIQLTLCNVHSSTYRTCPHPSTTRLYSLSLLCHPSFTKNETVKVIAWRKKKVQTDPGLADDEMIDRHCSLLRSCSDMNENILLEIG